jgi:hypothetical protein
MWELTASARTEQNPDSTNLQAPSAVAKDFAEAKEGAAANTGLRKVKEAHE